MHNALAESLLNRIHKWMIKYYLVISPRSKIKVLRDFQGFEKVERYIVDDDLADLEGSSDSTNTDSSTIIKQQQQQVYLFVCSKNVNYEPGVGPAFVDCYEKEANDNTEAICKSCGARFENFSKGLPFTKRIRQWKGHRLHCSGSSIS